MLKSIAFLALGALPLTALALSITSPSPLVAADQYYYDEDVDDEEMWSKLISNSGITLQWIGWQKRGKLNATVKGSVIHLSGGQTGPNGAKLALDGDVLFVDTDYFIFRGRIAISNTPDAGRHCVKEGESVFQITRNRKYWRLREFEWCDQLTDYVDIYF